MPWPVGSAQFFTVSHADTNIRLWFGWLRRERKEFLTNLVAAKAAANASQALWPNSGTIGVIPQDSCGGWIILAPYESRWGVLT